ncbi:spore cortex biosynthesis protein YabQ [Ruminiclostridium josui]|nr:spore cortex biosynthesis protein YabQ [Ruminiclostridium josui]
MNLIVEQVYIFFYAVLAGGVLAFLYDILRIKRRAIKTNVIILSVEDIIFWLLSAIIVFLTVYNSNDGQMRGFIFIGNILGVILYLSLFSKFVIASSMMVINFIKRIVLFIWRVVTYPFKLIYKIISVP